MTLFQLLRSEIPNCLYLVTYAEGISYFRNTWTQIKRRRITSNLEIFAVHLNKFATQNITFPCIYEATRKSNVNSQYTNRYPAEIKIRTHRIKFWSITTTPAYSVQDV